MVVALSATLAAIGYVLVPGALLPLLLFLGALVGGSLGRTLDKHRARKRGER